ncbi:MAG: glycosyltransferase family 2 protein [Promethearchaeota archaeon]
MTEERTKSVTFSNANIIAVIPAYNEASRITYVLKNCTKYVDKVIVVNDGSSDSTSEKAKSAGAIVISHKINKGKGTALRTGIEFIKQFSPQIVLFLDADGQDNPDFIPDLIKPIVDNEADLVLGSRFVSGGKPEVPSYKVLGNKILTIFMNLITAFSYNVRESQCGFRAIRYENLRELNLSARGFEIESEMLLEAFKNNLRVREVPIKENLRFDAIEKGTTIFDGALIPFYLLIKQLFKFLKIRSRNALS